MYFKFKKKSIDILNKQVPRKYTYELGCTEVHYAAYNQMYSTGMRRKVTFQ